MLPTWMNSVIARLAQDLLTSLAAYLTAQGIITNDQQASFVGAGFFLFMLLVNIVLHKVRGADAAVAGAASTGTTITPDVAATAIAASKGK